MATPLRLLLARLRALFGGAAQDREFAQELESHIEMQTEDNIRAGMPPGEARRQARIKVGSATSLHVQHRNVRGFRVLEDLAQDLRFAMRLMLKDRWFTAAAVAAIALGIGANTLGFTIVNAAFLRGFAFERADQLFVISFRTGNGRRTSSYGDLNDWRSQLQSFSTIGAYSFGAHNISDDVAVPQQTQGSAVTANFFDVLRQQPALGRAFVTGDDRPGADPVVIIGHDVWKTRFALDPNVLGRVMRVNGAPATIVGVMPEQMKFPDDSELWMPLLPTQSQLARTSRGVNTVGRLKDGVSREQATAEVRGVAERIIRDHPDETQGIVSGQVETLVERFVGGAARPMFLTVMGAVILVLLIACANVANLLFARALYRGREVAVRCTLGATRWRIVRQLLIESLTLAAIGGVIGVWFAWAAVGAFDAAVQALQPPSFLKFTIDYAVLTYAAGVCVLTAVLFGLAPALQLTKGGQHETLKEGGRGAVGQRRSGRLGSSLVMAELALTVVLLFGAGLLARSFTALVRVEPGFNVEGLMRMRLQLPPNKYPSEEARARFFGALQPKIQAIPGVITSAVTTSVPPLTDAQWRIEVAGESIDPSRRPWAPTVTITPDYFRTLGVSMTRGRALTDADGAPGADNVVISQTMADQYFRNEDPIGRQLRFVNEGQSLETQPWRTVVGVAAPFAQGFNEDVLRSPVVYVPFRGSTPRTASLLIRSALPPNDLMAAVRAEVQSIDRDQPVFTIESVAEIARLPQTFYRIFATVFGVLAAIGLTLSAIGVYGVMSYTVSQRRQEIGVRVAIGAQRWQVSWMFLRRCLFQIAVALVVGLPASIGLGQIARLNLVGVEPTDPLTLTGITVTMAAVALTSCLAPVRKASRVDPVVALRSE